MRSFNNIGAVLLPFAAAVAAVDLNIDDDASCKGAVSNYANGLMSYYKANDTNLPPQDIGYLPKPLYWWVSGAMWGGLVEYTNIVGDESYVKTIQQGLTANYGPENNFILDYKRDQTGNDDQAFWCLATMSAAEYGFPEPKDAPASYLEVSKNCFDNIVSRWDETSCGGGLKWQIYPENTYGWNYKNSISNGATFALGARLARFTGDKKYAEWAEKIYNWEEKVGLIGKKFEVFDGVDDKTNCAEVADKTEWTYNNAMMLHGSAFMADFTKDDKWTQRTEGFLDRASIFFKNPADAKNVMFEVCENSKNGKNCNLDQQSFKAYLGRWMAKTALLVPSTKEKITTYLRASAEAAAKSCTGENGACGSRWYKEFDGETGVGQQLSAMEITQGYLMIKQGTMPKTGGDASEPEPKPEPSAEPKPSEPAPESSEAPKPTEEPKPEEPKPEEPKPEEPKPEEPATSEAPKSTEAAPETTAAPSSTDKPEDAGEVPTSIPQLSFDGGAYNPIETSATKSKCGCTRKTTTVYVNPPPTEPAPALPPVTAPVNPPVVPTGGLTPSVIPTGGLTPPANNTPPLVDFDGAASSNVVGASAMAAAALAAMIAFL